ncbi:hypothetical protein Lesp02_51530 [Lentzea sp. NBRC 105346]|uniref:DUF4244 domain-containing protein n=1 Tax=Lentzea sp. NBRC 105346 TaxID=3032205 RepID=UPI0024A4C4C1|nr:DUF4244 domain-containing protein [Lentzea sp. NBRC 105346]GLZ32965.1 hypothetical protein Lesp02_51530 [Lentzea sp. NBRC 105346]
MWNPLKNDRGMSTVEYAIGLVMAAAFATALYLIIKSDAVQAKLAQIVQSALSAVS